MKTALATFKDPRPSIYDTCCIQLMIPGVTCQERVLLFKMLSKIQHVKDPELLLPNPMRANMIDALRSMLDQSLTGLSICEEHPIFVETGDATLGVSNYAAAAPAPPIVSQFDDWTPKDIRCNLAVGSFESKEGDVKGPENNTLIQFARAEKRRTVPMDIHLEFSPTEALIFGSALYLSQRIGGPALREEDALDRARSIGMTTLRRLMKFENMSDAQPFNKRLKDLTELYRMETKVTESNTPGGLALEFTAEGPA